MGCCAELGRAELGNYTCKGDLQVFLLLQNDFKTWNYINRILQLTKAMTALTFPHEYPKHQLLQRRCRSLKPLLV